MNMLFPVIFLISVFPLLIFKREWKLSQFRNVVCRTILKPKIFERIVPFSVMVSYLGHKFISWESEGTVVSSHGISTYPNATVKLHSLTWSDSACMKCKLSTSLAWPQLFNLCFSWSVCTLCRPQWTLRATPLRQCPHWIPKMPPSDCLLPPFLWVPI